MAWTKPTLKEIKDRVLVDFKNEFQPVGEILRQSVIVVLAYVYAAIIYLLFGALEEVVKNLFVDTAVGDFLIRLAAIFGVYPISATFSYGTVTVTGTVGTVVSSGKELISNQGKLYTISDGFTIPIGGSIAVDVIAKESGEASNILAGTLTFTESIVDINSTATIGVDGIQGGSDVEETEALRARLLEVLRERPHGGAEVDYKIWAKAALSTVYKVWVTSEYDGLGSVGVTFITSDPDNPIPSVQDIATVQAYIDRPDIRPVTARVIVYALDTEEVDFNIELLPDAPDTRTAVEANLRQFIADYQEPEALLYMSKINEYISTAVGEEDHILHSPTTNVQIAEDKVPIFGAITWV